MLRFTIQKFPLQNARWPVLAANPGDALTLQVDATDITDDQSIEFRILEGNEWIDVLYGDPGATTVDWIAPNLPGAHNLTFQCLLKEKPTPENGHNTIVATDTTAAALTLTGFSVALGIVDEFFVPGLENFNVAYVETNPAGGATHGRFEIWGERYPEKDPKPLYFENFAPGAVAWNTWDGQANQGILAAKFITPEFSPYRLRILIGPSQAAVDDPFGEGAGLVAMDERQFSIEVQKVEMRLMTNLVQPIPNTDDSHLDEALVIDPVNLATRGYAAVGRLPTNAETARIRIPMARHFRTKDALSAEGWLVKEKYTDKGKRIKAEIDEVRYSRPEIPVEFVPNLRSRDVVTYADGRFEAQASGPLKLEPLVEDDYRAAIHAGGNSRTDYWKFATRKVKRGKHNRPYNDGTNPVFTYWQARIVVAVAGTQDFDIAALFDNTLNYNSGEEELTVYLNRTKLVLSDRADDNDLTTNKKDYRENPAGAVPAIAIRLKPNFTEVGDILWVVRKDSTVKKGNKVKKWDVFPIGSNCPVHYGGIRGEEPDSDVSNCFRAAWSSQEGGIREKIIGRSAAAFPFKKHVELKPDHPKQSKQERVEVTAVDTGPKQGLAGVIFSPSYIAGDAYILHTRVESEPFERSFGFVQARPRIDENIGAIAVWRRMQIDLSLRCPDVGTNGMVPAGGGYRGVGNDAENTNPRPYHGDGIHMNMTSLNAMLVDAFCEWTIPIANAHTDINLPNYRALHNGATGGRRGSVPLNANADIENWFIRWDFYREYLPPGIPATRRNVARNAIHGLAVGTTSEDAGLQFDNDLGAHVGPGDAALTPGARKIKAFRRNNAKEFEAWVGARWDRFAYEILDGLTPRTDQPRKMHVVRWPLYHEQTAWTGYDTGVGAPINKGTSTTGFCRGDGQSFFRTLGVDDHTFEHEMGHSIHLVHFVAGNFDWKHHNVDEPQCLMSYEHVEGILPWLGSLNRVEGPGGLGNPIAPTGGGTRMTSWPDAVPAVEPQYKNWWVNPATINPAHCIHYRSLQALAMNRAEPCAKCCMKLRGWEEDVLPYAWTHPDFF